MKNNQNINFTEKNFSFIAFIQLHWMTANTTKDRSKFIQFETKIENLYNSLQMVTLFMRVLGNFVIDLF